MTDKTIVRSAGTTVWRQIEQALSADILAGNLTERLPNETALAERFSVNRHTVRQAVKALAERGMVEVVHGKGTFVRNDAIAYQMGRKTRFAHSVAKARRAGKSQLLHWSEQAVDGEIAQLLDLRPDAQVLKVESLDLVDDKVIGVGSQCFPLPRFAGFGEIYAQTGKTHLALAHFGVHEFQRRISRVTARLPDKEVAQLLGQPAALPILYVETVYVDERQQAIEYGVTQFGSASVQVLIEPD
ncbi:phosphonate metabolism transcriptional regulator PhnF [Paraherbaspirillum soli]|uniref:Phosphonate metabolism transcriptional regulator PhnF n=1 Tax=Paraherbaspirillum soli TaxID=631222 RepID=A0ABW0MCW5_9BURK